MTKELLLPHSFKKIGWVILIPTLLLGVLMLIDGFNGYPTYLMPAKGTACYETLCSATTGRALNNIALVGICIGGIFVACSRERIEDEMISRIRLNALLTALYVNYALLIATALCTYDLSFLYVMIYNLLTMLLIFLAVFRWKLWRLKHAVADEE